MTDHGAILSVSEDLVRELSESGRTISAAESCTGGWISKAITDVAGSSETFAYGIVSYSNDAKASLLGVDSKTLEKHGAVSEAVVEAMAIGVLELSGADIAVAVSGIAGPGGGSEQKPVGTVWFAWGLRDGAQLRTETDRQQFSGSRDRIRELTVIHALRGIIERLN